MRASKAGVAFAAFALLVSACGGDDAGSDGVEGGVGLSTDNDTVDDASVDGVEDAETGGPVDGALVSVLSFDFGLYALDRDTGEETEMAVADAGFSDREEQAFVTEDGSAAYLIVYTAVEGQSFTNDVALATIDMGTGQGQKLVEFGPNRESDDSLELTETRVIGAAGADVWVQQKLFAESEVSLIRFDATSGAETARVVSGPDDTIRNPVVVGDALYVQLNGALSVLDDAGSSWTTLLDFNEVGLDTVIDPADINDFGVTRSGNPISAEWADFILRVGELRPSSSGWASGDGSLWWLFDEVTSFEEDTAIVGGVVQFDLAAGTVVNVFPLGSEAGTFLEDNNLTALVQVTFDFVDGSLWMADVRQDGKLYRVEPSTGITAFDIGVPVGIDYTEIELVTTDPTGLWLEVTEWVITSADDDGGGGSSSGTSKYERYDTDSGTSVLEVDKQGLTGF